MYKHKNIDINLLSITFIEYIVSLSPALKSETNSQKLALSITVHIVFMS